MLGRDAGFLIGGMLAFCLALGIGIKVGWDWGRGDFATKAATIRAVATMKAAQRNENLSRALVEERIRRESLEAVEADRAMQDLDKAEELVRERASAIAASACAIDADGLVLLNQVLRGAR